MTMGIMATPSEVVALLCSMYLCKPSREALENWKAVLAEDTSDLLVGLKKAISGIDIDSEGELENLLWEYTRLFIGPYKLPCPPWESVYTSSTRLLMQDAANEVLQLYREAGLAISTPDVMPDHIGAELNFLAVLLQKVDSEEEESDQYIGLVERFLTEHLLKWVPRFTTDMEKAAEAPLYKALAEDTRRAADFIAKLNKSVADGNHGQQLW
jgi:TorA maturation chaperone TorD